MKSSQENRSPGWLATGKVIGEKNRAAGSLAGIEHTEAYGRSGVHVDTMSDFSDSVVRRLSGPRPTEDCRSLNCAVRLLAPLDNQVKSNIIPLGSQ
jgi:hypothetical protein